MLEYLVMFAVIIVLHRLSRDNQHDWEQPDEVNEQHLPGGGSKVG